jgi:hypothetical protein
MEKTGFPKLQVKGITIPDEEFPDRMTVSLPKGLDIVIIRTDVGYVVDAYHKDGQMLSTLNVWDDDIEEGVCDEV